MKIDVIALLKGAFFSIGLALLFVAVFLFYPRAFDTRAEHYFREQLELATETGQQEILLNQLVGFEWVAGCRFWYYGDEPGFGNVALDEQVKSHLGETRLDFASWTATLSGGEFLDLFFFKKTDGSIKRLVIDNRLYKGNKKEPWTCFRPKANAYLHLSN